METGELEEALKVLQSSLSRVKWRLKSNSRSRIQTDILALCSRMRAVVMVDYGGKMPELQERLCEVIKHCQKESSIFQHLRVIVIEDMIYLIHVQELAEFVRSSLNSETELLFVDLERDPPKMITQTEKSLVAMQLVSVQKLFSLVFPVDGMNSELLPCHRADSTRNDKSTIDELGISECSEFIDLSSCMRETQVTVPTLNGWLLGYPVVYLFGKEHIADAIYNLSTKSLRLFKVLVHRNGTSSKGNQEEELMRDRVNTKERGSRRSSFVEGGSTEVQRKEVRQRFAKKKKKKKKRRRRSTWFERERRAQSEGVEGASSKENTD